MKPLKFNPVFVAIFRRELAAYFATPLAYVFLVVFCLLSNGLTFFIGQLLERGQADLQPFFNFHPWLYLLLIPALTMRLWADEWRSGTGELLLTLPISTFGATLAKILACWLFTGFALLLTAPTWLTVTYLGSPDHGVIITSYLASWLMALMFICIGTFCSAFCKNQVVAFISSAMLILLFILAGTPLVINFFSGWAPAPVIDSVHMLSALPHFNNFNKGLLLMRDLLYFVSLSGFFLWAASITVNLNRGR